MSPIPIDIYSLSFSTGLFPSEVLILSSFEPLFKLLFHIMSYSCAHVSCVVSQGTKLQIAQCPPMHSNSSFSSSSIYLCSSLHPAYTWPSRPLSLLNLWEKSLVFHSQQKLIKRHLFAPCSRLLSWSVGNHKYPAKQNIIGISLSASVLRVKLISHFLGKRAVGHNIIGVGNQSTGLCTRRLLGKY